MISFILSVYIETDVHLRLLLRSINNIFKYHNDSNIYLINDTVNDNYTNIIENLIKDIPNIYMSKSIVRGSAESQRFNIIKSLNDNASHYILIHDSVIINDKFEDLDDIKDVKFLMHFTNHRLHWNGIEEEQTEFNIKNNIKTHTDLIRFYINKDFNNDKDFNNYANNALDNMNLWCGCLGNYCIITKKCVEFLDEKCNFSEIFINYNLKRQRMAIESIFALICHYYIPQNYEQSYDGIYHDGYNVNSYAFKPSGIENLNYLVRSKHISKFSFNR